MSEKRVQMNVTRVPAELKERIVAEGAERGISYSDAAVEKLATRFGVPFEARPLAKITPDSEPNPNNLALRMPSALRTEIKVNAAHHETSAEALICAILCDVYDFVAA